MRLARFYKENQLVQICFKSGVVILFFLVFYCRLESYDWASLSDVLPVLSYKTLHILIILLLLLGLNIYIEGRKWYLLVNRIQDVDLNKVLISVLKGVALGVITPARAGDYVGKLSILKTEHIAKGALANLLASLSQNIWNILLGVVLGSWYLSLTKDEDYLLKIVLPGFSMGIILIVSFLYYKAILGFLESRISWVATVLIKYDIGKLEYTKVELFKLLTFSLLRYSTYFFQFLLILGYLVPESEVYLLAGAVSLIFLIQSGIPLPSMLSIAARGVITIEVLGIIGVNASVAILASLTLWIVNLILPGVIGVIFVVRGRVDN